MFEDKKVHEDDIENHAFCDSTYCATIKDSGDDIKKIKYNPHVNIIFSSDTDFIMSGLKAVAILLAFAVFNCDGSKDAIVGGEEAEPHSIPFQAKILNIKTLSIVFVRRSVCVRRMLMIGTSVAALLLDPITLSQLLTAPSSGKVPLRWRLLPENMTGQKS